MLVDRVFLARGFHSRKDSQAYHHNRARENPMLGHMHEVRRVSQTSYENCVSRSINSK